MPLIFFLKGGGGGEKKELILHCCYSSFEKSVGQESQGSADFKK